ncbi:MAG: TetR/AcrR family transcriptional regulator [Hyphomonadaceae bacterium]
MARLADPDLATRRRQQILEAAETCFRRRGFHQATMQEICAEARISPGALYRYFGSKADIIAAISEFKHREGEEEFIRVFETASFSQALEAVFLRMLEKAQNEELGAIFADIMGEAMRDPVLARRLAEIDAHSTSRLAEAVQAAQMNGEIDKSLDPDEAADTLCAFMEGLSWRRMKRQDGDADTLVRQFRAFTQRYLAPAR